MARQDNPFALLGDDDDGTVDVMALLAKAEARSAAPPQQEALAEVQQKPKQKEAGGDRYVRGGGRGGRGRGTGRGGYGVGGAGGYDGVDGEFGNGYPRAYGGEFNGRGSGRGGRGGGRGRGRGRGFYDDRGFGGENWNQGQGGEVFEAAAEGQGEGYGNTESRPFRYEDGKFGEENRNSEREGRRYGGENRGYRGGRGRGGYGSGNRGFGGRDGRIGRGDEGHGFGGRSGVQSGNTERWNDSEKKEEAADGKESAVTNTNNVDGGSGWDAPATSDVQPDAVPEQINPEQVGSKDATDKNALEEQEDNNMTLEEYEKLLQEKRKALEALKPEERKVVIDKEFDGMQLVEKKKEEEVHIKKSEKDKLKKKDSLEKEERARKSMSINEFLKPPEGSRYAGRGRGGRGRGREDRGGSRDGYFGSSKHVHVPSIEDQKQFPVLGGVAKA